MLSDGAAGLAAVKRCGGIVLVQAPRDALAPDMPLAAIEATPVDLSAAAADLITFVPLSSTSTEGNTGGWSGARAFWRASARSFAS